MSGTAMARKEDGCELWPPHVANHLTRLFERCRAFNKHIELSDPMPVTETMGDEYVGRVRLLLRLGPVQREIRLNTHGQGCGACSKHNRSAAEALLSNLSWQLLRGCAASPAAPFWISGEHEKTEHEKEMAYAVRFCEAVVSSLHAGIAIADASARGSGVGLLLAFKEHTTSLLLPLRDRCWWRGRLTAALAQLARDYAQDYAPR